MKKTIVKLLSLITLSYFVGCDIKVDPNLNYEPIFRQDQANIYIKTQNVPISNDQYTSCELNVIHSNYTSYCQTYNKDDGDSYCSLYFLFSDQGNIFPLRTQSVTQKANAAASTNDKEFLALRMRESANYNFSYTNNLFDSYTGLLSCFSETTNIYNGRTTYQRIFEKSVVFNPDLQYVIPMGARIYTRSNLTSNSVQLIIDTPSSIAVGARLQRSLDNATWTTIATLTTKRYDSYHSSWFYQTYMDTGLTPSTTYYYRAVNYNASIEAEYFPSFSVTTFSSGGGGGGGSAPSAPTAFAVDGTAATSIDLSWTDNSNNETGFEIDRSPNGTTGWVTITTTAADVTSFTDTGLTSSTTYYYRLRSVNASGNSAYTAVVNGTTSAGGCSAPFDPTGLNLTLIGMTQINLVWTDTAIDETGFVVERSTVGGSGPFSVIATLGADITTYSNTGLAAGTTFYYRVKAIKTSCADSGYTTVQSQATPGGSAPTAPSSLVGFPDVGAPPEITLTWQDNSSDETGFEIERSTVGGGVAFTLIHTTSANDLSYNDNTASASTTYYYRVRAVNVSGNSAFTSESTVVNP